MSREEEKMRSIKEYENDVVTLKNYGNKKIKLTLHRLYRNSGLEVEHKYIPKNSINDSKLENNLSRAKNKVFELAICNDWNYFVTLTIDPLKYDRTDLNAYKKQLSQWIRNYNKKYDCNIKYLLIPELHKDGCSWHMHGLIRGVPPDKLSVNNNNYLDWIDYKLKFGYISLDKIRNEEACCKYITKYITKDLQRSVTDLGAHLYYCSQGLKKAETIKKGHLKRPFEMPDFENEYVKVKYYDIHSINDVVNIIE